MLQCLTSRGLPAQAHARDDKTTPLLWQELHQVALPCGEDGAKGPTSANLTCLTQVSLLYLRATSVVLAKVDLMEQPRQRMCSGARIRCIVRTQINPYFRLRAGTFHRKELGCML
eukprot:963611-Amphidinium_carterae.1